ncbi:eukaryotic integral membrane protein-domain-containing protein [Chlamydoabsidia padenii]|nr:eukaryotic integral membrane protein-domain-containing protein [Chlamydoabsidia padenii]
MAAPFKSAVTNIPVLTKALLTSVVMVTGMAYLYIQHQAIDLPQVHCNVLGLVPGLIMYAPWTIITSLFYENTVWTFLSSLVILLLCGKYLERVWGSRELLTYILVTGIVSNVVTWFGLVMTFYLSGDDQYLYDTQINGMAGVFSGFLVAFKYLIPEHRISVFGVPIIRVKNVLGLATLLSVVCLIVFKAVVFYNLVNIGWVAGWIYIRFFRLQEGGIRGDRSEAFALVTFFPEFLSPVIGGLSNLVYQLFVSCHLCPPTRPSTMYDMEHQSSSRHSLTPLPGSARAEAERRRALALKALDMRLSTKSSPTNSNNTNTAGSSSLLQPPTTSSPDTSTQSHNTNINADALMEQHAIKNDILFDASSEINKEG